MSNLCKNDIALSCKDLSFSYQQTTVLHNISLQFHKGEFIALLGKNGAGKSTLLSCLIGLLPSDFSHLEITGLNPLSASRTAIARQVSFVPQEHDDMFPFSVVDVVVMGRTVYLGPFGAPRDIDYTSVHEILEELYISHLKQRIYNTLSGGEKQLVLLARALVQTRTMVFLDEPTNHLDYKNRFQILANLKKQCVENNSCVVACLHDPNYANIFADRVILINEGRIVADGKTDEIMTGEAISRLYGLAVNRSNRTVEPCFCQPAYAGKVLLLVGASGSGKTTTLQKILSNNKQLNFAGIICPGTWKNDKRHSSSVINISTGESTLFAKRSDEYDSPFTFFKNGQKVADRALVAEELHGTDCIIVDEVGPLELRDGGHAPQLPPLLSLEKPKHIWAIRPSIVAHVCSKWMLVDPVIIDVNDANATSQIQHFLKSKQEGL